MRIFGFGAGRNGASADLYFSSVALLLNMEGDAASTTFLDSSSHEFTVTAHGNAQLDTARYRNGRTSGLFDGLSYLTAPDNTAFELTGDFTVETWVYCTANSTHVGAIFDGCPLGGSAARANTFLLGLDDTGHPYVYSDGGILGTAATALTLDTWQHIALVRFGSNLQLYLHGTSVLNIACTTSFSTGGCVIGSTGTEAGTAGYGFIGNMDGLRITNGIARFIGNFNADNTRYYTERIPVDLPESLFADSIAENFNNAIELFVNSLALNDILYIDAAMSLDNSGTPDIVEGTMAVPSIAYIVGVAEHDVAGTPEEISNTVAVPSIGYVIGNVEQDSSGAPDELSATLGVASIDYPTSASSHDESGAPDAFGSTLTITGMRYLGVSPDAFAATLSLSELLYVDTVSEQTILEAFANTVALNSMTYTTDGPVEVSATLEAFANTISLTAISYVTALNIIDNSGTPETFSNTLSLSSITYATAAYAEVPTSVEEFSATVSAQSMSFFDGWVIYTASGTAEEFSVASSAQSLSYFDGWVIQDNSGTAEEFSVTISAITLSYA